MKKLLLLFAIAAFAACNTEDGSKDNAPQSAIFGGTLTVTSNQNPDAAPFTASNVRFELTGSDNNYTLTMHEIKFASAMPMSLTISIPDLVAKANKEGTTFSTTGDPIAYFGNKPHPEFKILDFKCTYLSGALSVSFTCRNPDIPVGGAPLDHKAVYTGQTLYTGHTSL